MTTDATPTPSESTPSGPTSGDPAAEDRVPADPASPKRQPRWRRFLVGFLVVLGCLLVPLSVLGVWVHATLLETDQYVDTVGPLVDKPAVQEAVANRLTNAITQNADIEQEVSDLLPSGAQRLAPTIAAAAEQAVGAASTRLVESDQFSTLWKEVNRRAHTRVVAVLQGEGTDTVETKNGEIVLQLTPFVDEVKKRLDQRGISFFDDVELPKNVRNGIVIFASDDLRTTQSIVDLLDTLYWLLPLLVFVVFAAAILLSGDRRRTVMHAALGVALAMGVLLTVFNVGRRFYLDALPGDVSRDAAADVYDQVLVFLRDSVRTVFFLAIVVAIGAWLVGAGHLATRIRTTVKHGLDRTPSEVGAPAPIASFVARSKAALRVVVIAIGGVILVAMSHPTPLSVLFVVLLVLIGLGLVEVLGRSGATGSGTPDQTVSAGV